MDNKFKLLSPDAMYLGSSMFSMMEPNNGKLTFAMQERVPSPRTSAALDELVSLGLISVSPFNQVGGVVYTPLVQFPKRAKAPSGPWPITVEREPRP